MNRSRLAHAHAIAHWIEWMHAQALSRATKGRQSAEYLYDPLAATCLGDLLYDQLCVGGKRKPEESAAGGVGTLGPEIPSIT